MEDMSCSLEDLEEYHMMVSKTFKSEEQGFQFYNAYAWNKGFSVRKDYVERDRDTRMIVHRRFLCSREGYRKDIYMDMPNRKNEPRALSRCGCPAEYVIALDRKSGDWYVKKFVDNHNHQLAARDQVFCLWSHRGLSEAQEAQAIELKSGGLRKHQVMDVMEKFYGGFEEAGFISRDLYNFFHRYKKKKIVGSDADHVIKYMQARQQEDMDYFFEYETDDKGCLTRLFWADPQSRIDYDVLGDVVVFDSTYRVNRYNLPFVPFVGVNHHGSTVIFGCGIVSNEKIDTYEWLLRTFLNCMCQKHPKSFITDGDSAMRKAIQIVFPNSDHRLCTWHIEQNMQRHLGADMLPDFRHFVHAAIGVEEFERMWVEFKERFEVSEDNVWLSRMYSLRQLWAGAYTKGRVFLGMKSNQRSESLNSTLHRHLDRKMSLVDLVEHYEHCLSRMRHKEAEFDGKASQSVPFTRLDASELEKDAAVAFTPYAFKKVKSEINESMNWEIRDIVNESSSMNYILVLKHDSEKVVCVSSVLDGGSLKRICCPCRKLECEYLPCQHIFVVLQHMKLDKVPQTCIMRRWTPKAKCAFPSDRNGELCSWSGQMERWRQLRSMGSEAFFKASMTEEGAQKVKNFLLSILQEGETNNYKDAAGYGSVVAQSIRVDQQPSEKIHDPTGAIPKGAPSKRMRQFNERRRSVHCRICSANTHATNRCPLFRRERGNDV